MAILIPSLDDRNYDQLVELLRRQIAPGSWSDHNASDPGMMLVELLCWLGEMSLYRMNRVPSSHQTQFLDFLIDPPEPVSVEVEFRLSFAAAAPDFFEVPAGTLLATDFSFLPNGARLVFETVETIRIAKPPPPPPPPADPPQPPSKHVRARAILQVFDEQLGVSDGSPDQTFPLRPPRQALEIGDPDVPLPAVVDFVHLDYAPFNPKILVGGAPWTLVPSLRTQTSQVGGGNPAEHFMIDVFENRVRFGDGTFGAVPPAGSPVLAERYAVLDGPRALRLRSGDLKHLLNLDFPPDIALAPEEPSNPFGHHDALGGSGFFAPADRFSEGLKAFRARYRLVSEEDFETAVLKDFNNFQDLAGASPKILRAAAVMNRRPPLEDDVVELGYVSLLVVSDGFDQSQFRDPAVSAALKETMLAPSPELRDRLRRFLDPRRLITTRLRVAAPNLEPLDIVGVVAGRSDVNLAELKVDLEESPSSTSSTPSRETSTAAAGDSGAPSTFPSSSACLKTATTSTTLNRSRSARPTPRATY